MEYLYILFPRFRSRSDRDEFSPAFQGREAGDKHIHTWREAPSTTVDLKYFLSIVDRLRSGVADAMQFSWETNQDFQRTAAQPLRCTLLGANVAPDHHLWCEPIADLMI
jgi:hypothetical protein